MKRVFIVLMLCGVSMFSLNAQRVIIEESNVSDTLAPKSGPNYKHYLHPFISLGSNVLPGENGALTKPGLDDFSFGFRYKLRIAEPLAVGFDLAYNNTVFRMKQTGSKNTPDTLLYDAQRMEFHSARLGAYIRINYGRRGNSLGKYVDLGAYSEYNFAHTLFTKSTLTDGSVIRINRSKLDYYQPITYGLQARIGFNKIILYGNYRLSPIFFAPYNFTELSPLIVGIQFVLN
ncbi:MAG: outer membrane beta-barrel protein [Bacteroidia bacterium]